MASANQSSDDDALHGLDERTRVAHLRKLRALRLMLVAAIALPLAALGGLAWSTWRDAWHDAEAELGGSSAALAEYSLRVLDNYRLVADRVNDMLHGVDDDSLRAREREFHDQLRAMTPSLPLVQTVAVNDRNGRMLLTANVYPVPRDQDFSDREWIQALRRPGAPPYFVSRVYVGRLDQFLFFAVARRRAGSGNGLPPGEFDGAINVSVQPTMLAAGFGDIIAPFDDVAALVRDDGQVLARRPGFNTPPGLITNRDFLALAAARAIRGVVRGASEIDGEERLVAVRRVGDYGIYALTARDVEAIIAEWRERVVRQLLLGLPAAALMIGFAWIALRRGRESAAAQRQLSAESARRAVAEASAQADQRFRAVFESRAMGMAIFDPTNNATIDVNDRFLEMTGHTRDEATRRGWDWRTGSAPETAARDEQAMGEIRSRGWWDPYEKDYIRSDGSRLPVRLSSARLPGEPRRVVVIAQDISEQRESEMRRDLLMREVEHRAKNSLAVVQATLRLGARHAGGDSRALIEAVDGRIRAIAGAQTLLRQHQWEGADLAEVLIGALAPFADGPDAARVRVSGPPLAVHADAVQPLAMAIHEIATNAAKYGALAREAGRLAIDWSVDEAAGMLRLRWRERGGDKREEAPIVDGFGARLIDAMLVGQLGGSFERRWTADGLVLEIELPLAQVRRAPAEPTPA